MDMNTSGQTPVPRDADEDNNDPPSGELKKRHSRKFNVLRFEKRVAATFSILSKLFTISVIVVATLFIFSELADDSYSIQQMNVPASFEESGLSGVVVANLISDRLIEIFEVLRSQDESAQYIKSSDLAEVEVDMVGLGVPIRGFIALIGDALGFRKGKKISGDIFVTSGKAIMILRITGHPPESFEINLGEIDLKAASKALVDEASKAILKYTHPMALELYYSNIKHDGPNTVKMAKYLIENFSDNPEMVRHAYDSWAWGLMYEDKLEEAQAKIKEGLEKFPNDLRLYNAWGSVLTALGENEEAIKTYKMVFKLAKKDELSDYRKGTMYCNIGNSFAYLAKYDSAMDYYLKALVLDKNDWILYYNMGGLYLLKADTANFYEYLERSLQKGADVEMIRKDRDLKSMINEKRVQDLLTKYSD